MAINERQIYDDLPQEVSVHIPHQHAYLDFRHYRSQGVVFRLHRRKGLLPVKQHRLGTAGR